MNRLPSIPIISILLILLSGCAARGPILEIGETRKPTGIYYQVKRGDTIWRIAKLHDVEVRDIVKSNKLPDAAEISVGQKLFIPTEKEKKVYSSTNISDRPLAGTFSWPVAGKVISHFGDKKGLVSNKGIDIKARTDSKVVASYGGVVSFVDENMKGLGKTIIIDHQNGFSSVYAHNSEILVKVGQNINRNQPIAKIGKSGRAEFPYLHFEIRKGHEPQNPFYYLP